MPIFTAADIPAKNVTWQQFIAIKYTVAADPIDTIIAQFVVPTGKIAEVLEIIRVHVTDWGTTTPSYDLKIDLGASSVKIAASIAGGAPGTTTVLTRATVLKAAQNLNLVILVQGAGAGGQDDFTISGQFADA